MEKKIRLFYREQKVQIETMCPERSRIFWWTQRRRHQCIQSYTCFLQYEYASAGWYQITTGRKVKYLFSACYKVFLLQSHLPVVRFLFSDIVCDQHGLPDEDKREILHYCSCIIQYLWNSHMHRMLPWALSNKVLHMLWSTCSQVFHPSALLIGRGAL